MLGSLAMALRYSFDLGTEADRLERAIGLALSTGYRTADIAQADENVISTKEMGDAVMAALDKTKV